MPDEENIVTLVDEDGKEEDFAIEDMVEIDDCKYAVLVPVECLEESDEDEEYCEAEAVIMKIEVDEKGEEYLTDIDDDEEYERVVEALEAFDEDEEDDDLEDEDDDEDEEDEEY
ncbi:MAG: DUF1292 domain-containing protein [Clostridia bacterium]|nr:DUF1292 domain-containing protein [Clostridia bacterium]